MADIQDISNNTLEGSAILHIDTLKYVTHYTKERLKYVLMDREVFKTVVFQFLKIAITNRLVINRRFLSYPSYRKFLRCSSSFQFKHI